VFGIVHADTDHFGARNHRREQFCLLQRDALFGGVNAMKQRISPENNQVIPVDNPIQGFSLTESKPRNLHVFSVPSD
jgi:hypothetical protein